DVWESERESCELFVERNGLNEGKLTTQTEVGEKTRGSFLSTTQSKKNTYKYQTS
ncbi:UNVERIFIED_CONTAM: hypothetical protein K2H54_064132, partial [Gekko kuhli]